MSLVLTREALSNQIADDLATRNTNAGLIEGAVDGAVVRIDTAESDIATLKGTGWAGQTVKGNAEEIAEKENLANKKSTLVENSEIYYPNQKAVNDGLDTKTSKSQIAYNNDTTSFIANTLTSGAIIERGSNANGSYIKFADGTMVCDKGISFTSLAFPNVIASMARTDNVFLGIPPTPFLNANYKMCVQCKEAQTDHGTFAGGTPSVGRTESNFGQTMFFAPTNTTKTDVHFEVIAIGRWK